MIANRPGASGTAGAIGASGQNSEHIDRLDERHRPADPPERQITPGGAGAIHRESRSDQGLGGKVALEANTLCIVSIANFGCK